MRYARAVIGLVLVGTTLYLAPGAEGTENETQQVVTHLVSTPDNGCPAWARDTMNRTTTVEETEEGVVVSFHDEGVFVMENGEEGTVQGDASFEPLEGTVKDVLPDGDALDNAEFPCKDDVPQDRRVSSWPLRYVDTYKEPVLAEWSWTYDTVCDSPFTEDAESDEVGAGMFPEGDNCVGPEGPEGPGGPAGPEGPPEDNREPANCDEADLLPPQYWPNLDEDGDGISCEGRPSEGHRGQLPVAPPAQPVPAQPSFTG